jgi:hypothetical protein
MRDTQEKYLRNKGITTSNLENLEAPQQPNKTLVRNTYPGNQQLHSKKKEESSTSG